MFYFILKGCDFIWFIINIKRKVINIKLVKWKVRTSLAQLQTYTLINHQDIEEVEVTANTVLERRKKTITDQFHLEELKKHGSSDPIWLLLDMKPCNQLQMCSLKKDLKKLYQM